MGKMSKKLRATDSNVEKVPNTSGVYILNRGDKSKYVGSAGAGNLQNRIEQQLDEKRGITSFQYRKTGSEKEARALEKKYRDRINPEQKRI
ncbi:MAG: hypothetical protein A2145_05260 [candidate division Zixibacteria bacterium RBG_16_40_9]|nr:MAG: hypothetical protein A2145_05260 [candidate division Zixibacteria bacterium RBG_16_40_9]